MTVCQGNSVAGGSVSGPPPAVAIAVSVAAPKYFSQTAELQQAALLPSRPIAGKPQWSLTQCAIAREFNRLGGLLARLAQLIGIPLNIVLGLWFLESSGTRLVPGQALLRLEVHHLWQNWGRSNAAIFDQHFQFGGRNGVAGHAWEGHAYRAAGEGAFAPVHAGQASEYAALRLATELAGAELPLRCISIGGCQLLGCDFARLGYASAQAMYQAFQQSEQAQVLGFFDFCARQPAPHPGDLLEYLRSGDFARFAHFYNGGGEEAAYAAKLKADAADAGAVLTAEATT